MARKHFAPLRVLLCFTGGVLELLAACSDLLPLGAWLQGVISSQKTTPIATAISSDDHDGEHVGLHEQCLHTISTGPFLPAVVASVRRLCLSIDGEIPCYHLFRTMTGVGTVELDNGQRISVVARPEIILEGTKDGGQTWKAYHFKYKPGDVMSAPRVVAPFHPRLDWQMWFAGLGDYQSSPWLVHFVAKLLEGSPDVKELLDVTRDPFADAPPDAIRAQLYYYDFTRLNTSWNQATPTAKILDNSSDPQWWTRTFAREYLPALERGNPSLAAFVQHHWHEPSAVSKLSPEASALRQWTDRALTWLCRAPWSPVGLALGFVVSKSGVAASFRCWLRRRCVSTKLKLE